MKNNKKPPLYTLAHGIEVIGEYPARGGNRYVRLRIRPHPFFPGVVETSDGIMVRKSRVVLSAKLGRALLPSEQVHHKNENRDDDSAGNLEIITAAEHNKHHKTGTKHREESKRKTSDSMKRAHAEGRHGTRSHKQKLVAV